MSLYPSSPRPTTPYAFRSYWPSVTGGPDWAPQSRALTRFNLVEADLIYKAKSFSEVKTLYDFFENVRGASGRFTFADFNGIGPIGGADPGVAWASLFVASGDGIALEWDLPTFALVASPAPVVYANAVAQTSDIYTTSWDDTKAFHIKVGAGTDGVDLLTAEGAITAVATAPSPATSGTSLVVAAGKGARFAAAPFYANLWPTAVDPSAANVETVQVTAVVADTLTIVRAQNGTTARTVVVGDQIAVPPLSSVILTVDATCRRALRRARFLATKNPFLYEVPAIYSYGPVTIVEVRK